SLMRDMHEQINELNSASISQQNEFESLLKSLEDQANLLASTPAIRPISRGEKSWVTSKFGFRQSPFTGQREFHQGYDISTREGTPIMATADGVVIFVGRKGLLGNTVIIDHGHGLSSTFIHLSKILVKPGDDIVQGQAIAEVGATGRATGPHLDWRMNWFDQRIDPVTVVGPMPK
ncbi:MAG: M23 family metallopeptidase, partial [Gammaproteobacteria bacterium]